MNKPNIHNNKESWYCFFTHYYFKDINILKENYCNKGHIVTFVISFYQYLNRFQCISPSDLIANGTQIKLNSENI